MDEARARVLYIEDDPGLARLVEKRLIRHGHLATVAGDGDEGLARLNEENFDVAITDYRMPGRDGLEVIRAAKAAHPDLPLIMVSGMGDLKVAVEAMKLGAAEYVIKDVEGSYLDLLPTVVDRLVETRRLVAEKRAMELALGEERALSRAAVDSITQGLAVFDGNLALKLCNNRFLELRGYPAELGRCGTPLEAMLRLNAARGEYGPSSGDEEIAARLEQARSMRSFQYERAAPGGLIVEVCGRPMADGFVVTYTDITERKRAEQKIWHQANYDTLTGVANRSLFHELLKRQLSRAHRARERFTLLFIDLDGFKAINDTLGHEAGDMLLKAVAERLKGAVRESDVVSRLGGDEFTVLMADIRSSEDAGAIAGAIIQQLSVPYDLAGREARISASIGIACYPDAGTSDTALINRADAAMYAAKSGGRGCWEIGR